METSTHITSVYRFLRLSPSDLGRLQMELESFAREFALHGLCLIGEEGVNLTVSGSAATIERFKICLAEWLGLGVDDLHFKDSMATRHPFQVFRVKVKDEIVTLGRPDLCPASRASDGTNNSTDSGHISPREWHEALREPDTVVIDTRNDYEVGIGKFKSAVDFGIKEFREFPEALRRSGIDKDKKVLIYCTGGIRCEKAILDMREQGYKNVRQLSGGILSYLKEFPEQEFEGECFVFDYRVAVDQRLNPSQRYKLCPHCGQPAHVPVKCVQCGTEAVICSSCESAQVNTCSKNCAHHQSIGSRSQKPHHQELGKRHIDQ